MLPSFSRTIYPLIGAAIIVVMWHLYVVVMKVPLVVLPTPLQVAEALVTHVEILLLEGWVTALECIYGFLLSVVIGIPIAVVMTYSRLANLMFYPLLVASQDRKSVV